MFLQLHTLLPAVLLLLEEVFGMENSWSVMFTNNVFSLFQLFSRNLGLEKSHITKEHHRKSRNPDFRFLYCSIIKPTENLCDKSQHGSKINGQLHQLCWKSWFYWPWGCLISLMYLASELYL